MYEEIFAWNWIMDGKFVKAKYLGGFDVFGKVVNSRVAYGGGLRYTIELETPVEIFGRVADTVIVRSEEITNVYRVKKVA